MRSIETGGAALNIRVGRTVQSFDGDKDVRNQLRFQAGLISSTLEHAVPEQMFSDPANPTDGVSAVKALQLAAQQGQKIYQIDSTNLNVALNDLSLDISVKDEIRDAVNQGRIAIAHQSNIQVPGWSGAGYIILDPEIMDGSYKISGGGNGGFFAGLAFGVMIASMLAIGFAAGGLIGFIAAFILISQIALPIYLFHVNTYGDDPEIWGCWQAGVGVGTLGVVTIAAGLEGLGALAATVGSEWLLALLTGTKDQVGGCFR